MQRTVDEINYCLTYKKVKNINLRVGSDGAVSVSAPKRVSMAQIDAFVAARAQWIARAQRKMEEREPFTDCYSNAECLAFFGAVNKRIYAQFADLLPHMPALRVRLMKSRWGVCHPKGGYITLNKQLMEKPLAALEYVMMHEYVHFLHPNHQAGFHQEMARRMPDYKKRRAMLYEKAVQKETI